MDELTVKYQILKAMMDLGASDEELAFEANRLDLEPWRLELDDEGYELII